MGSNYRRILLALGMVASVTRSLLSARIRRKEVTIDMLMMEDRHGISIDRFIRRRALVANSLLRSLRHQWTLDRVRLYNVLLFSVPWYSRIVAER